MRGHVDGIVYRPIPAGPGVGKLWMGQHKALKLLNYQVIKYLRSGRLVCSP